MESITITPDGEKLYVCSDRFVKVLRLSDGVVQTIDIRGLRRPNSLCISPDGEKLYVADENSRMSQIPIIIGFKY